MPPVPPEEFASLLADLDESARLAFLADLWAARGWSTAVDDGRVVARRGAERRTIATVTPGRFGEQSVPDVDVVVATRDDERLASAARAAGAQYLPPAGLRDRLLYGLERERAADLFERHFDRPLVESARERRTGRGLSSGAGPVPEGRSRRAVVAALLVLLLGGATVAPWLAPALSTLPWSGGSATATPAVTPVQFGTGTPTRYEYPPGLSADGIGNRSAVVAAHRAALRGQGYAWRVTAQGPSTAPGMSGSTRWNLTAAVENRTRYRWTRTAVFFLPNGSRTDQRVTVYADGSFRYRRYLDDGTVRQYNRFRIDEGGSAPLAPVAGRFLERYLATNRSTVTCAAEGDVDACPVFRVVATGDPLVFQRPVGSYRAVALVRPSGFVSRLRVEYTLPTDNGTAILGGFRFRYTHVGAVTVRPPRWLDEAKEATSGSPTPATSTAATRTGTAAPGTENDTMTSTPSGTGSGTDRSGS